MNEVINHEIRTPAAPRFTISTRCDLSTSRKDFLTSVGFSGRSPRIFRGELAKSATFGGGGPDLLVGLGNTFFVCKLYA